MSSKERTSPVKDCTCISDALPVLTLAPVPRSSVPADFKDLAYSPTLLLSAHFDAFIADGLTYDRACEDGFNGYFEEMVQWNEAGTDLVFMDCFYTRAEVMSFVARGVIRDRRLSDKNEVPFWFRVGFVLGWLSALSLTDRVQAFVGFELLMVLVAQLQKVVS